MPTGARGRGAAPETLLASMMARSAPRALLVSPVARGAARLLEHVVLAHAVALTAALLLLHATHVRGRGCAEVLRGARGGAAIVALRAPGAEFRHSAERGLLLLSPAARAALNVSVLHVALGGEEGCLGHPVAATALRAAVGYRAVAANAFLGAFEETGEPGFLRSLPGASLVNLRHAGARAGRGRLRPEALGARVGALLTALFIMGTTGAIVSFTLKEVQVRIVKLAVDLRYAMRSPHDGQIVYARLLVRYACDALVFVPIVAGMLFFLFEFFDDQPLAFGVLVVAWLAEVAVTGSNRHWVSRQYLPRLFFLYFGGFHFYFFSFPLGFTWLAFVDAVALMFHACLAVWNRYEMPLILLRPDDPREQWQ